MKWHHLYSWEPHWDFRPEYRPDRIRFDDVNLYFDLAWYAGIAFGFDRLVSMFAGLDSIRDVIAFPKNNSGRDVMNDSPSPIAEEQLKELNLSITISTK